MEELLESMKEIKVRNFTSNSSGREVANQFIIDTPNGTIFQSYDSIICLISKGQVYLDSAKWDYSMTTGKYRNQFLGENIQDTRRKIERGIYKLVNLN